MKPEGFRVALIGESSLAVQEFMAILEAGPFPLGEVIRMGLAGSWETPDEADENSAKEPLPPLDWDRASEADVTVLAGVPQAVREAALQSSKPEGRWVLDMDAEGAGSWADPYGDVENLRDTGFHLRLPDPGAVYAALLGRALDPFAPVSLAVCRFQPASIYGEGGVRDLHAQATRLLNFLPAEPGVFGGQAAFNLLPSGPVPRGGDWVDQVAALWDQRPSAASVTILSSTFHGAAFSMLVRLGGDVSAAAARLEDLFASDPRIQPGAETVTPVGAASEGRTVFRALPAGEDWLSIWCAYDNMKAGKPAHAARILATLAGR
jgi:hypothetical protein